MKLLSSTGLQLRRLLHTNNWFTLVVVSVLVGLEWFGRMATSDLHDTLGAGILLAVGVFVGLRHRQEPLPWVQRLIDGSRSLGRWVFHRLNVELGMDLRLSPPIPQRLPKGTLLYVLLTTVWLCSSLLIWQHFPQGWRGLGVHGFYLGYLLLVVTLWVLLFGALLIGIYIPVSLLHIAHRSHRLTPATQRQRTELISIGGYLVLLFFAHWLVPPVAVLLLCAGAFVVCTVLAYLPEPNSMQFLWRDEATRQIWAVPPRRLMMAAAACIILLLVALMAAAAGGRFLGAPLDPAHMPVTILLGTGVIWLTPGILLGGAVWLLQIWWHDPARRSSPIVRVFGRLPKTVIARLKTILRQRGWRARQHDFTDARVHPAIELVEPERSEATEFDPDWPLRVTLDDLESDLIFGRIERRRELQLRRQFLRGLDRLFRLASPKRSQSGHGFWVAPHLWFVPGMTRDEPDLRDGDEVPLLRMIGPPYRQVFHRHVRQYVHYLLRTLQVDLIFVEDGVTIGRLKKVLRALFEVYDRFDGQRPAEDVLFQGLPKVRVMIHEMSIEQPFRAEGYPEPRFDDISRVRIMHIFRDRGEQEEPLDVPADYNFSPSPVLVG